MNLPRRLKDFREEARLSLVALAEESNISKGYLWRLENDQNCNPSIGVLYKIATAMGITVTDLLDILVKVESLDMADLPESLSSFIKERGEELDIQEEDIKMLRSIVYRGRRPNSREEWEFIFRSVKMTLGRR